MSLTIEQLQPFSTRLVHVCVLVRVLFLECTKWTRITNILSASTFYINYSTCFCIGFHTVNERILFYFIFLQIKAEIYRYSKKSTRPTRNWRIKWMRCIFNEVQSYISSDCICIFWVVMILVICNSLARSLGLCKFVKFRFAWFYSWLHLSSVLNSQSMVWMCQTVQSVRCFNCPSIT